MNKIVVDKDYVAMKKGNTGELYCRIVTFCNGPNLVDPPLRTKRSSRRLTVRTFLRQTTLSEAYNSRDCNQLPRPCRRSGRVAVKS